MSPPGRFSLRRLAALAAKGTVLPVVDLALRRGHPDFRAWVFRRAGAHLGVTSVTCAGALGSFEGDARDGGPLAGYLARGTWAPEFQALARERIFSRGSGTFVDVGANIGLSCIPLAKSCGVRCLAFEPEPANFRYLERNLAANGAMDLVRPYNLALMDANGSLEFELSDENMGDHRVRIASDTPRESYGESARRVVRVEGRRLDGLVRRDDLPGPVMMKVDTQGAEARVLRGAAGILDAVDVVFLEYWPYGLHRMGDDPEALFSALSGFEYGWVVDPDRAPALVPLADCLAAVRRAIPVDGSSIEHLDLLLARRRDL